MNCDFAVKTEAGLSLDILLPGSVPENFKSKDGWNHSRNLAHELGIKHQDYCVCVYSQRDRLIATEPATADSLGSLISRMYSWRIRILAARALYVGKGVREKRGGKAENVKLSRTDP